MQAQLEARGLVTASVTMLVEVTDKVRPPRALSVPFALGYPLGEPNDAEGQIEILQRLLALCEKQKPLPILEAL